MASRDYSQNVFINCPFDDEYKPLFEAIVFTVFDCGFIARCALEEQDASQIRLEKLYVSIGDCRYAIHDISRTELDAISGLPRFNIPLELGLFLSAKRFGSKEQQRKQCLILDRESYRYQRFISDISGQDIEAHANNTHTVITLIRNWLRAASRRVTLPGGSIIFDHYQMFRRDLPQMCRDSRLKPHELTFNDYALLITEWLKAQE